MHNRAPHHGDGLDALCKRGIKAEREPKVGERPYGDDRDFSRRFCCETQYLLNGALV